MPAKINFILCVHNHQPAGNFHDIIESAYKKAYKPFLDTVKRFKNIKICIHNSGVLYDFYERYHPEYLEDLKNLIAENRIELLSGAYYEPILTLIPERDIFGQVAMMNDYLNNKFGYKADGMWVPERVWDPYLVKPISESALRYVPLDTGHFLIAGLNEEDLMGYFVTEEHGDLLSLFHISKKIRYMIPYKSVRECIDYLRSLATDEADRVIVFGDDGEKFGFWPGSYRYIYEEKWLENFFKALSENSVWLNVTTFSEILNSFHPLQRIYIPNASYAELMEWALPIDTQLRFREIMQEIVSRGEEEKYSGFIRGGFFRNFLVKYREADRMHKKMIEVSERVKFIKDLGIKEKAKIELYKGQCSCAYWHGVFGGLYLNFLRKAVYSHLIKAENYLGESDLTFIKKDFNIDGHPEVKIMNKDINLYISPRFGGSIYEMDFKPVSMNLLNCITRRPEAYHPPIEEIVESGSTEIKHQSIHLAQFNMDKSLYEKIVYDWYTKTSFVDHFISHRTQLDEMYRCKFAERGSFVEEPYNLEYLNKETDATVLTLNRDSYVWAGTFRKKINLKKTYKLFIDINKLEVFYSIKNISDLPLALRMAIELNFGLDLSKAEKRYIQVEGKTSPMDWYFGALSETPNVTNLNIIDEIEKYNISINTDTPVFLWRFPIETVSRSESGFEVTYQGTSFILVFDFIIKPEESFNKVVTISLAALF
ncbi:MAG: alpha-amylase/4-alpha-glucanotransferase domain-containing protein [Candidatus Hydrogenedentota bacterium]